MTSGLFQPEPFAAGSREPVIVGGVSSILILTTVVEAVLPEGVPKLLTAACSLGTSERRLPLSLQGSTGPLGRL